MLRKNTSFKRRYKQWKRWARTNTNGKLYQIAVLFGVLNSPTFETMYLRIYFE